MKSVRWHVARLPGTLVDTLLNHLMSTLPHWMTAHHIILKSTILLKLYIYETLNKIHTLLSRTLSCHTTPQHTISWEGTLQNVTSYFITSYHTTAHNIMKTHTAARHITLFHAIQHQNTPYHQKEHHSTSHHTLPCHTATHNTSTFPSYPSKPLFTNIIHIITNDPQNITPHMTFPCAVALTSQYCGYHSCEVLLPNAGFFFLHSTISDNKIPGVTNENFKDLPNLVILWANTHWWNSSLSYWAY